MRRTGPVESEPKTCRRHPPYYRWPQFVVLSEAAVHVLFVLLMADGVASVCVCKCVCVPAATPQHSEMKM